MSQTKTVQASHCPVCQKKYEGPYRYCIYDGNLLVQPGQNPHETSLMEYRAAQKQSLKELFEQIASLSAEQTALKLSDQDYYFCFLREYGQTLNFSQFEKLPQPTSPLALLYYLRLSKKLGYLSSQKIISLTQNRIKKIRDVFAVNETVSAPISHLKLLEPPLADQA